MGPESRKEGIYDSDVVLEFLCISSQLDPGTKEDSRIA